MPMCVLTMSQPASGRCKSHTKITFFFKKNLVNRPTFAGQPTKSAGPIGCASFILELPYLAHISSLWLA